LGRIDTTASYAQEVQSLYAVYEKRKFNDALIDDLEQMYADRAEGSGISDMFGSLPDND